LLGTIGKRLNESAINTKIAFILLILTK